MPSYLDYHGLQTFKGELDDIFATKMDANKRGANNGVASLDSVGKVPVSQIPGGTAGGVAMLDANGKLVSSQLVSATANDEGLALKAKTISGGLVTEWEFGKAGNGSVIYEDAEGRLINVQDGADDLPLKKCVVNIEFQHNGTGDPSPSNIRPIIGWDYIKFTTTKKNLFGGDSLRDGILRSMPLSAEDDPVNRCISFAANATVNEAISTDSGLSQKFKENTRYSIIVTYSKNSGQGSNLAVFYTDGTSDIIPPVSAAGTKETKRLYTAANKTVKQISKSNSSGRTTVYYDESGVFEGNVEIEDFIPYEGKSVKISFDGSAGTVYGGKLDVLSGLLTITEVGYDLGQLDWEYVTDYTYPYFILSEGVPYGLKGLDKKSVTCEKYKGIPNEQAATFREADHTNEICFNSGVSTKKFIVQDPTYTSAADFKASLNGIIATAKVDDGPTYQLPKSEIHTLLGENNFFARGGSSEVTYPVDTKTYVDNVTPDVPIEDVQINGVSAVVDKTVNITPQGLGLETGVVLVETVSGTTPEITGQPNTCYQCGEVATLTITPPAMGTVDVYFTSGTTPTVLTIPSTVMMPEWFDPEALDADTVYEIMITNGVYGTVMTWPA